MKPSNRAIPTLKAFVMEFLLSTVDVRGSISFRAVVPRTSFCFRAFSKACFLKTRMSSNVVICGLLLSILLFFLSKVFNKQVCNKFSHRVDDEFFAQNVDCCYQNEYDTRNQGKTHHKASYKVG